MVYALPKTALGVDVNVKKTRVIAGKYAEYTSQFFDLKPDEDYPTKNSTSFTADSVAFKTRQLADSTQVYRVQLTQEWMKDHHFALEFAEDGTLGKGEITITNRRVDFFLGILGTVASVAGKFIGAAALTAANTEEDRKKQCDSIVKEAARDEDRAAKDKPGPRRAFCEIVQLSRRRQAIVLGEQTVMEGTAALLQDIDLQLKKLFSENFTGSRKEESWTARFEHIPGAATVGSPVTLLVLDDACGVKTKGSLSLDPQIGDDFEISKPCPTPGAEHTINLSYAVSASGSLHSRFSETAPKEHSFAFRIPGAYKASVKDVVASQQTPQQQGGQSSKETLVGCADVGLAQLGRIGYMPAAVGGKKSSVTVTLHANGALKAVDIGVEAQGNIAETAGTAATGLVDAALARRTAAQDEADPVAQAEKKQKLLEAQVAAMRAQCILDGRCPLNPE